MFSKFSTFTKLGKFPTNLGFQKVISRGMKEKLGFKEQSSSRVLGYGLLGLAAGGLGYLMYNSGKQRAEFQKSLLVGGTTVSKDLALARTKHTLLYLAGGITMTSVMVAGMLRSPTILRWSSGWAPLLVSLPVGFFCIYKMYSTPYTPQNQFEKHLYWIGFNAAISFSMVPLIAMTELVVIRDAFILTAGLFGGLGLVSYNSRDDAFLGMSGILGAGLGGIAAIGVANIFLQSNALFNIWLYAGLALFLGFVLHDMKEIQIRAGRSAYFDPMTNSIGVYLDLINIFQRLLIILQSRKNRK